MTSIAGLEDAKAMGQAELSIEKVDGGQTSSLHSSEADIGYELFWQSDHLTRDEKDGRSGDESLREWEADSRNVLKKIDRRVLPILCVNRSIGQHMYSTAVCPQMHCILSSVYGQYVTGSSLLICGN